MHARSHEGQAVEQGGSLSWLAVLLSVQRAALKAPPPFGRTLSFVDSATRLYEVWTPVPKASSGPFPKNLSTRRGSGSRRHSPWPSMYRREADKPKTGASHHVQQNQPHRPPGLRIVVKFLPEVISAHVQSLPRNLHDGMSTGNVLPQTKLDTHYSVKRYDGRFNCGAICHTGDGGCYYMHRKVNVVNRYVRRIMASPTANSTVCRRGSRRCHRRGL